MTAAPIQLNTEAYINGLGKNARMAAKALANATTAQKNQALMTAARQLRTAKITLLAEKKLNVAPELDWENKEISERFTHPVKFKFIDENGEPIKGDFTMHQTKDGRYKNNWYRYLPLDDDGEIVIKKFPPEFQFGGSSENDFYHYWFKSDALDAKQLSFTHRCEPTGAMKFEIIEFPKKHYDSLVVEYHKKVLGGFHRVVRGIGIHPDDPEHTVGDLKPGEYFIAIKFDYEDKKAIYKSSPFTIKLKEYTVLPKIKITEKAINETDKAANPKASFSSER